MQDNNLPKVKERLIQLSLLVEKKGIRGLAEFLNVPEGTLYGWVARDKIGDTAAIIKKIPNARFEWLETGTGPMLTSSTAHLDGLPHPSSRGMAPANSPLPPPRVDPNYYHPASEGMLPANLDIDAWSEAVIDSKQLFGDIRRANVEKCYQVIMRKREEGVLTENTEDPPPAKTETPLKQAA